MQEIALQPLDSVTITSLMDNFTDMLLTDSGPAKRWGMMSSGEPPLREARTLDGGTTVDQPQAEHGFSALVTFTLTGVTHRLLFDAGVTPDGTVENMRRFGISPKDVDVIVLSHGHFDHTTGLDGFIRAVGRASLPVIIHPEFWSKRRIAIPGRTPHELPSTSRSALVGAGFEIIENRRPSFLLDGAVLVTGEVNRTTAFERGFPVHEALRDGAWQPDPLILDDQALVMNVRDRGLVVLTGCGHAGIVNIVRYAKKLTGIEQMYAVLGGFHLSGALFESVIPAVVDALSGFQPQWIVPAHCTGWRAQVALANRFPDSYLQNSVGTRFEL
jgi:7,8-dihydropterin-6-yl-methyl-4-(beta-D-ribofuranosyl)aminobenzene 5'-phosphate synthase